MIRTPRLSCFTLNFSKQIIRDLEDWLALTPIKTAISCNVIIACFCSTSSTESKNSVDCDQNMALVKQSEKQTETEEINLATPRFEPGPPMPQAVMETTKQCLLQASFLK